MRGGGVRGCEQFSDMAESDDVDDVEEQEFLRLSSELGAEFVRLVLGEAGRDGDEGTASMGPGDGKESEGASGGSEEPPRDPPPRPDNVRMPPQYYIMIPGSRSSSGGLTDLNYPLTEITFTLP